MIDAQTEHHTRSNQPSSSPHSCPRMPILAPKQQLFVEHYLESLNASEAVRKAGYRCKRADQQGYELLRKPEILRAVQESYKKRLDLAQAKAQKAILERQEVLQRDSALASVDLFDAVEVGDNGGIILRQDISEAVRKCIASIKSGPSGQEVKFYSPHPSLERLAKYHGLTGNSHLVHSAEAASTQDDKKQALLAADWLERFSRRHGTDSAKGLVALLRRQPVEEEEDVLTDDEPVEHQA